MKNKDNVDFHSTQLYINRKEDVEALNKDFKNYSSNNKSEYLRDLIIQGLISKHSVSLKEKEQTNFNNEVLTQLSLIVSYLKEFDTRVEDIEASLKDIKFRCNGIATTINLCLSNNKEQNNKVLGSIYNLIYRNTFKIKTRSEDVDKGIYDSLPSRLKEGNK